MDKLFVYTDQQNRRICECAACGFVDQRNRDAVPGSADFRRGLGDDNVQVIKLVDPGSI
jgi:Zn ribbon nucleic-acid-binding protein